MKPMNGETSRIEDFGVAMQCYEKSERGRATLPQHYCTEKSASSGYYSSNICSNSSIDDHIYSEPVIDAHSRVMPMMVALANSGAKHSYKDLGCKTTCVNESPKVDHRALKIPFESISRNMAHYPKAASLSRSQTYFPFSEPVFVPINDSSANHQLPTIMEGLDDPSPEKTQNVWSDTDDSLMDIDMDSFLLANERKRKSEDPNWEKQLKEKKFFETKVPRDDVLENNYKCARYVNSCPEDPYKVESVLECFEADPPDKPPDLTTQNCWGNVHIKDTRAMLKDIRKKLCDVALQVKSSPDNISETNELHANIEYLQTELENYWKIVNRNSDMEIRQFCAGIINDQKLVAITKAFERRNSTDRQGQVADLEYGDGRYDSIRCSDPNFKMKRKSFKEAFANISDEYRFEEGASGGVNRGASCQSQRSLDSFDDTSPATSSPIQTSFPNDLGYPRKHFSLHKPRHTTEVPSKTVGLAGEDDEDKNRFFGYHSNKPSIWEQYYGTRRINQTLVGKRGQLIKNAGSVFSYPSSRPESDFTLDHARAEQLHIKLENEKAFRRRCRILTTFFSLVFFLLTVISVSLLLTRGKRLFGSML